MALFGVRGAALRRSAIVFGLAVPVITAATGLANKVTIGASPASAAITQRKLYRGTTAGFTIGPATLLVTSPTFPYDDTTAIPGVPYFYALVDSDGTNNSAPSNVPSAQATGLWTPSLFGTRLLAWFDAMDTSSTTAGQAAITVDGSGNILSWGSRAWDRSIAYTATAAAGNAVLTTDGLGTGKTSALFGGAAYLSGAGSGFPTGTGTGTLVAVGKPTVNSPMRLCSQGTQSGNGRRAIGTRNTYVEAGNGLTDFTLASGSPVFLNNTRVVRAQFDSTGASLSVDSINESSKAMTNNTVGQTFALGALPAGGEKLTGHLGTALYIGGPALTTEEGYLVDSYCAWRWGTQANLDAGNPHKSAAPTV